LVNHRAFKDELFGELASIGQALANGHRLELLDLLAQGERSVEDLAREAAMSMAATSSHLQVLRRVRLVESDKRGLRVVYRLASPEVFTLWRTVRDIGSQRLAEVDRIVQTYLSDRESLEAITSNELLQRMRDDSIVVLDVRPVDEYRQGHIATALSVPVAELANHLAEMPRDREIVAYCRGPYCVFADEAIQILRDEGYAARRLVEGFPEWRAAHFPIEFGSES
jgi:rhodanese-related sulfurtransferase